VRATDVGIGGYEERATLGADPAPELHQLRLLCTRGTNMTIFSPRASTMAHHFGDEVVSQVWTRHCNDLIARVVPAVSAELCRYVSVAAVAKRADRTLWASLQYPRK